MPVRPQPVPPDREAVGRGRKASHGHDRYVNPHIEVELRAPRVSDAAAIFQLIERIHVLERNSPYAYVLLCSHFAETGVVAEYHGQIVGFVLAYRPPTQAESVFVWQVGVAPEARGQGLASRMLDALVERPACATVRYLTATVSPDNAPSQALFRGFATRHQLPFNLGPCYPAALFAGEHADEDLFQIGPLRGGNGAGGEDSPASPDAPQA